MTESDLPTLISEVCEDAGRNKGIEFRPAAPWGAQTPGSWEVSYRLKRLGWSVALTHWFSVDRLISEEVFLRWAFPPTPEQHEQFKSDVSAKIDQMLEWLKKE